MQADTVMCTMLPYGITKWAIWANFQATQVFDNIVVSNRRFLSIVFISIVSSKIYIDTLPLENIILNVNCFNLAVVEVQNVN